MRQRATSATQRRWIGLGLIAALTAVVVLALAAGSAAGGPTKRVAKIERTKQGSSVLANLKGLTLYSLSVEKHGKFICVKGCLSVWHPLTVPKGVTPKGPVKLGTVKRPDNGKIQVTYHGRPLYHFAEDAKPGETNGEGFRDVGTWHAAKPGTTSSSTPEQPGGSQPYPPTEYPTTPAPPKSESPPSSPPSETTCAYPPYCY